MELGIMNYYTQLKKGGYYFLGQEFILKSRIKETLSYLKFGNNEETWGRT